MTLSWVDVAWLVPGLAALVLVIVDLLRRTREARRSERDERLLAGPRGGSEWFARLHLRKVRERENAVDQRRREAIIDLRTDNLDVAAEKLARAQQSQRTQQADRERVER